MLDSLLYNNNFLIMKSFAIALVATIVNAGYTPDTNTPEWIAQTAAEKSDGLW